MMTLAIWCVLAAGLMPIFVTGLAKAGTSYDNSRPRETSEALTGWRKRAYSAHLNCYEAFPLFAAAVLVAHQFGKVGSTIDTLALAWIAARLVYVFCYVTDRPSIRSLVWTVALVLAIAIFTAPAWA